MDEVLGTLKRRGTVGGLGLVFDTAAVRPKAFNRTLPGLRS